MANDFIIKNGLILNNSNSINKITSGDTSLTTNENALVSEYTIKKNLENYLDSGTTLNDLFDVDTTGVLDDYVIVYSANTWIVRDMNGLSPSVTLSWDFDGSTTNSDPGNGDFRFNNTTTANITEIYVDNNTVNSVDVSTILSFIGNNNKLYIQQKSDSSISYLFDVISSTTDNSGWWTIHVSFVSGSASLPSTSNRTKECGFIVYSDITTELSNYTTLTQFYNHTGDTSIHYIKSDINLVDLGITAHTHTFSDITDMPTELPTLTISYTATTPPATFGPVVWNRTDVQNNTSIIELNSTTTSRIDIKETGLFFISYQTDVLVDASTDSYGRVSINGTTTIAQSNSHINTYANERHILMTSFSAYLTAGTYIELQLDIGDQSNDDIENTTMTIMKLNVIGSGSGSGSGTPGGNDTEIQFNNSGSFAGSSNLTWDGTTLGTSSLTLNSYLVSNILDEDTMVSDSATALATQQSIKAYVDSKVLSNYAEQPAIQLRYATMGSSTGLVPFDTTDLQNNTSILEHNTTTVSRIDIKETGLYRITYTYEVDAQASNDFSTILKFNGTNINSSNIDQHIYNGDKQNAEKSIIYNFTSLGYLEMDCTTNPGNIINIMINVTKLDIVSSDDLSLSGLTDVVLNSSTNGESLVYNGTNWVNSAITSGGGTPGGNDHEIQFNNSGSFDGDSNLTWVSNILNSTNINTTSLSATTLTLNSYYISDILDEDDMSSDSNTALATQQSIKAYVDDKILTGKTFNAYPTTSQTESAGGITVNYSTIRAGSSVASISSGEITLLVGGEKTIIVVHTAVISTTTRSTSKAKIQIDDGSGWSDITNAQCSLYHRTSADGETTSTITATITLNVNDKIRVIAWNAHGSDADTVPAGCSISLISTTGPKGDKGDTGSPGDIDWQHSWTSKNYTVNQTVEYLGSSYICILDTTSSQNPTNTTYWDLVASKGDAGAGSSVNIHNNNSSLGSFTDINFNSGLTASDAGSGVAEINLDLTQEYMVSIWAEENAALADAAYEWAFGNGANTANDGGVTIYVPSGWNCEVKAMSLRMKSGTATVELVHNGTLQGSNCDVTISTGQSATNDTFTPISISDGDYINFRTTTANGTASSTVVTAWLRYYK
jgi:hypothetical protein